MKKILPLIILLFVLPFASRSQYVTIPDPNFKAYLQQLIPTCFNGSGQMDTICSKQQFIDTLNASNLGINDITGIQYLDPIFRIDISHNQVSQFPQCTFYCALVCSYNMLTSLDVTNICGSLNCSHNLITNITFNNCSAHDINCSYNQLTALPPMTFGWGGAYTSMNCSHNQLDSLPPGYADADILDISYNNFTSVPATTNNLVALQCSHNFLTAIDFNGTTPYLDWLDCSFNQITSLPTGMYMNSLFCNNNQLTSLPLINSLIELNCSHNQITSLAQSPAWGIDCSNNPISCLPVLNNYIDYLTIDSTQILCMPNYPLTITSNLPLCINDTGTCATFPVISGKIFKDDNGNNIQDTGEPPLPWWAVQTLPYDWYGSSDTSGNYSVKADTGISVSVSVPYPRSPYYISSPASYSFNFNAMNQTDSLNDFAFYPLPNINDLQVSLSGFTSIPGDTSYFTVSCFNVGTTMQNASVQVTFPDSMVLVSSVPPATNINGHTLTWAVNNFNSLDWFNADIELSLPATVPVGTPIHFEALALPVSGDSTPADNLSIMDDIVAGSFDPNDKSVSDSLLSLASVANKKWIDYTIRFQNTGNYPATTVLIKDTLSDKLEIASIQVVSFSHPYSFNLSEHGVVTFRFDSIMLPDSGTNMAMSHGFIKYRIRCRNTLQLNDEINNSGYIYFDYNSPVQTNTVKTTVVNIITGNNYVHHDDESLLLFPNPAKNHIQVNYILRQQTRQSKIMLTDLFGREMLCQAISPLQRSAVINIEKLSPGCYFVSLIADGNKRIVRKVVKE